MSQKNGFNHILESEKKWHIAFIIASILAIYVAFIQTMFYIKLMHPKQTHTYHLNYDMDELSYLYNSYQDRAEYGDKFSMDNIKLTVKKNYADWDVEAVSDKNKDLGSFLDMCLNQ